MPVKLSTTVSKIESLSNSINSKLTSKLYEYMNKNSLSESHINNTLKILNFWEEKFPFTMLKAKNK